MESGGETVKGPIGFCSVEVVKTINDSKLKIQPTE